VALGFATFDGDRAWRELELLLEGQWANGMVRTYCSGATIQIIFQALPSGGLLPIRMVAVSFLRWRFPTTGAGLNCSLVGAAGWQS